MSASPRHWGRSAATALWLALAGFSPVAEAQQIGEAIGDRIDDIRQELGGRGGRGVLGLMGYQMTPDGSANAVQVNRSTRGTEGSPTLTLSQFGFGFTVSESVPIYLEIFAGTARYDPRSVLTGGGEVRRLPLRWNNVSTTMGVGYDFRLAQNLWLRPIINLAAGYAASDAALFGAFIGYRRGVDISRLTDAHVNVWGHGMSLVLAYYDYRPERDIDFELRYTHLTLETFGDTLPIAVGSLRAQTLGLWGRYRWPTGYEAFGRPIRWVLDGNASSYLGEQRDAIGFDWSVKVGGGIEFDVGRYEIGAMGINLSRVRLIGRYFYGDNNITGASFGIGMSF
jgi:hypothetical protein